MPHPIPPKWDDFTAHLAILLRARMKLQNDNCQLIHEILNLTLLENNHNNLELPNREFF